MASPDRRFAHPQPRRLGYRFADRSGRGASAKGGGCRTVTVSRKRAHCAKCAAPGLASLRSRGRPCAVNHSSEPSSRAAAPDDTEPLDPVTSRVALSALRLLAGTVPKKRLQALRQTVDKAGGEYPWERVTDALNAEPAEQQQLVQQGLRAQRDWILRGGRETPKASMKSRG